MAVLWRNGSGTVAEVRDALDDTFAYTTVLTVLRTLEDKGFVTHVAEGKAHRYLPAVTPDVAGQSALSRVLDKIFGGSPDLLLTQLVSDHNLDTADLRRLRKLLDDRLPSERRRTDALAWMAYAVLFGALTYGAALAADRVAATWGREQRYVWVVAVIVAAGAPPRSSRARPHASDGTADDVATSRRQPTCRSTRQSQPASSEPHARRSSATRGADASAPPTRISPARGSVASLAWLALLARAAIAVRRRRARWRSVEIDGASVLVSPSVGPAVIGAFSPRVVIPAVVARARRAGARAHAPSRSRTHPRSRSAAAVWRGASRPRSCPWNPAVWLLARRLRLAIEIDCDQRVLGASAQRREYGELLLTVGARHSAPLPFATSLAERRPFLERRIRAMTTTTPRYPRLVSAACIGLAIVATTAAVRAPRPASLVAQAPVMPPRARRCSAATRQRR